MEVQQRTAAELYLDLLKKCLICYLFGEDYVPAMPPKGTLKHVAFEPVRRWLSAKDMEVIRHVPFDQQTRAEGRDWPAEAESMIGLKRLDNLQHCVTDVLRRGVPGDLIETGAWRAGPPSLCGRSSRLTATRNAGCG
jgi:O-methyltransferase